MEDGERLSLEQIRRWWKPVWRFDSSPGTGGRLVRRYIAKMTGLSRAQTARAAERAGRAEVFATALA
jgi:hypothetical protein